MDVVPKFLRRAVLELCAELEHIENLQADKLLQAMLSSDPADFVKPFFPELTPHQRLLLDSSKVGGIIQQADRALGSSTLLSLLFMHLMLKKGKVIYVTGLKPREVLAMLQFYGLKRWAHAMERAFKINVGPTLTTFEVDGAMSMLISANNIDKVSVWRPLIRGRRFTNLLGDVHTKTQLIQLSAAFEILMPEMRLINFNAPAALNAPDCDVILQSNLLNQLGP